jgi:hypothetical protein
MRNVGGTLARASEAAKRLIVFDLWGRSSPSPAGRMHGILKQIGGVLRTRYPTSRALEEVKRELEATREAIGSGMVVQSFTQDALQAHGR